MYFCIERFKNTTYRHSYYEKALPSPHILSLFSYSPLCNRSIIHLHFAEAVGVMHITTLSFPLLCCWFYFFYANFILILFCLHYCVCQWIFQSRFSILNNKTPTQTWNNHQRQDHIFYKRIWKWNSKRNRSNQTKIIVGNKRVRRKTKEANIILSGKCDFDWVRKNVWESTLFRFESNNYNEEYVISQFFFVCFSHLKG